jgi:SAM-dependent methyltransferase
MRHESSLDADYFEGIYAGNPDPWGFETSAYEQAKYDHTLNALPRARFQRALEVGCAGGVLTARLAGRCGHLIAVDVVESVLERARRRCQPLENVEICKASLPRDRIAGPFDLIVISEVAYYWDSTDLAKAGGYLRDVLARAGHILLVHWTGETDYPKSADDAVAELFAVLANVVITIETRRMPQYRLDLWRRHDCA